MAPVWPEICEELWFVRSDYCLILFYDKNIPTQRSNSKKSAEQMATERHEKRFRTEPEQPLSEFYVSSGR